MKKEYHEEQPFQQLENIQENKIPQTSEKYKKWTLESMDLPPLVEEVNYYNIEYPVQLKIFSPQSLVIFVKFHLEENEKNLETFYFVCQDNQSLYELKINLLQKAEKKGQLSPHQILLYDKNFPLDEPTLKECNIKNNAILDAWLDTLTEVNITFVVIQQCSRLEFQIVLCKFASFSQCFYVFLLQHFEKQISNFDLFATILFKNQRILSEEMRTLQELGIKNGSTVTIVFSDKHGCFPSNTPVKMRNGSKVKIENVQVGDEVMSFDTDERVFRYSKVIYKHYGHTADFIILQTKDKEIKTTANNPFLTKYGWKAVYPESKLGISQLTTEDCILDENKIYQQVISIKSITEKHSQQVFNLTLEAKSIFVTSGFVVLHCNFNAKIKINNKIELFEITYEMMVQNIKAMILMQHEIRIEDQEIYYNDQELQDDAYILEQTQSQVIQLEVRIKKQIELTEIPKKQKMIPSQLLRLRQLQQIQSEPIYSKKGQEETQEFRNQQSQRQLLQDSHQPNDSQPQQFQVPPHGNKVGIRRPKRQQLVQTQKLKLPNIQQQENPIKIKVISHIKAFELKIRKYLTFQQFCQIIYKFIRQPTSVKSSILHNGKIYDMTNINVDIQDLGLRDHSTLILFSDETLSSTFQFTYSLLSIQMYYLSELIENLSCCKNIRKITKFIEEQKLLIQNDVINRELYQRFELHHLIAIKLWTSNLIHRSVNVDLRINQFSAWNGYLKCLMQALRNCPYYQNSELNQQISFRGCSNYQDEVRYQPNKTVQWHEISASSQDINVAINFAQPKGMLFEIKLLSGKDIGILSIFTNEKEVLTSPFTCFLVQSATRLDDDIIYVQLVELPQPRSCQIILWVDDNPENNYKYVEQLEKEKSDISVVFCTSTRDALQVIKKYRFMIHLDESDIRIITDMVRFEEGKWNYDAGINFVKKLILSYKFNYEVLVFCFDEGKAKENFRSQNVVGNYCISSSETKLNQFIRFQD